MKIKEIQEKRTEDLNKLLLELAKKMQEMNFKNTNNQLKNIREIRDTKKTIARIKTVLNQRNNNEEKTSIDNKIEDK
jgi:large subunit ribosomal protein L29